MPEIVLITVNDVREYADLQPTFDESRFEAYVRRVQRGSLRDLLRPELYRDMFQKITNINTISAPYETLVNGESYLLDGETVDYYGIKPFVIFHFLALQFIEGNIFLTDTGVQEFSSNLYSKAKIDSTKANYLAEAARWGNEIIRYLDEKKADYPLWEGNRMSNPSSFGFRIL